jgi:hypothetical protein
MYFLKFIIAGWKLFSNSRHSLVITKFVTTRFAQSYTGGRFVIPAQAGILPYLCIEIPACAGMTSGGNDKW